MPPASGPGGPGPAFSEGSPAAPSAHETLADLGEWELIRRLGCFAPPGQFADDAALLPAGESAGLVVNTDVLVEGLHFSEATTEPGDVGWRAAAANLSDLAAMGCTEVVGLTVGLVAPASTPWAWVEGVYGGLRQTLDAYGGVVLGGDCSGGGQRILAITAIGRLAACTDRTGETTADRAGVAGTTGAAMEPGSSGWAVIRRGDGRPGDLLVCTGPHGLSRLGLALLQGAMPGATAAKAGPPKGGAGAGPSGATVGTDDPAVGTTAATTAATGPASETDGVGPWIDPDLRERAIAAHRRPRPRFDAVGALIGCRPAGEPWRVGGCDSSDGLAAAVAAIAASSGCGALLNPADLPLDRAMAELDESEAWCLGGGEDFELVLALAPVWAEALVACLPGSRVIGGLVAGAAGTLGWSDGRPWPQGSSGIGGFRHFG